MSLLSRLKFSSRNLAGQIFDLVKFSSKRLDPMMELESMVIEFESYFCVDIGKSKSKSKSKLH